MSEGGQLRFSLRVFGGWSDSITKNQPIPNSNQFFVLQSFLDDKTFTKPSQVSKTGLAKIFPTLVCRRQDHFRRKASQRDLIFGDPKFSFAPLFDFFDNFGDLCSVAGVNKMSHELLLPLLLSHNKIFHKKYVFTLSDCF